MNIRVGTFNNKKSINFKRDNFEITNLDGIHCAYCGNEMISKKKLNKLFSDDNSSRQLLIDRARESGYMLNSFRQQVLNYLTQIQYEYEYYDNDLFILSKAKKFAGMEVERDIQSKFVELERLINNSDNKDLKNRLKKLKQIAFECILRKKSYSAFLNFIHSGSLLGILPGAKKGLTGQINNFISDISSNCEYSIFEYVYNKYRNLESPQEFYKDLYSLSISTLEHIRPVSKNGENDTSNFLAVCNRCNSNKSNLSLLNYFAFHPELAKYIPAHIKELKEKLPKLISDNKISKHYKYYPETISRTIESLSKGKINVEA